MIQTSLSRLSDTVVNKVLPHWLTIGRDEQSGHFHEALTLDGERLPDTKLRTRTAARMIYVYAQAAHYGIAPPGALDAARKAAQALDRDATRADGGYVRAIDRTTGHWLDPVCDLYDHSCVLLANAALLTATGDGVFERRISALLQIIDRILASPHGGWAEDDRGRLPRSQNSHMHLFEALLLLCQITDDPEHIARLRYLRHLFLNHFRDADGVMREFFGPSWEVSSKWGSDCLDPGHMAEWSFYLAEAGSILGVDDRETSNQLMRHAITLGTGGQHPLFFFDAVDAAGQLISDGRRLWPQVEQIKGCLVTQQNDRAEAVGQAMLESYLSPIENGVWIDRYDLENAPIAKNAPGSSCYHLSTLVFHLAKHYTRTGSPSPVSV